MIYSDSTPAELVEHIAETHRVLANRDLALNFSQVLDASENLLRNAILNAYPHLPSAQDVIERWFQDGHTVKSAVNALAPELTKEDWYRRRVAALERLSLSWWAPPSNDLLAELSLTAELIGPMGDWRGDLKEMS